jgi:hypothetical protein
MMTYDPVFNALNGMPYTHQKNMEGLHQNQGALGEEFDALHEEIEQNGGEMLANLAELDEINHEDEVAELKARVAHLEQELSRRASDKTVEALPLSQNEPLDMKPFTQQPSEAAASRAEELRMKDSQHSEALRTIQAQLDQALKAKDAEIDGKLAKMNDALKQHSQALELLRRQSKGITQNTNVSSTEKSTDFQSTLREQSQALTELDAQCETLINDRTTASAAGDTPSDYNILDEEELVDEQRRTTAELRRDAEKALTAARMLVQTALEPANITQAFPRETALTLANAETWFQKKKELADHRIPDVSCRASSRMERGITAPPGPCVVRVWTEARLAE